MKRSRFSDEQVIGILQEHEAGAKCVDLCRKHGMSEGTFYVWKPNYSGMTVPEVKRLKALEEENVKLKKLLAEQMLDAAGMKTFSTIAMILLPLASGSFLGSVFGFVNARQDVN